MFASLGGSGKRDLQHDSESHWIACHSQETIFASNSQFTANGHFSIPRELYQEKPGNHEASGFVNSTVKIRLMIAPSAW